MHVVTAVDEVCVQQIVDVVSKHGNHGVLNYRPTHHAADLKMWGPIIFSSGWRNN